MEISKANARPQKQVQVSPSTSTTTPPPPPSPPSSSSSRTQHPSCSPDSPASPPHSRSAPVLLYLHSAPLYRVRVKQALQSVQGHHPELPRGPHSDSTQPHSPFAASTLPTPRPWTRSGMVSRSPASSSGAVLMTLHPCSCHWQRPR